MSDTAAKDDASKPEKSSEAKVIDGVAEETPKPASAAKTGGSRLVVGISVGVAAAALLALGLVSQGILHVGGAGETDVSDLQARLKALETSTENADAAQVQAIRELREQLASLDVRVQEAASDGGMGAAEAAAFADEVAALKSQVAQLSAPTENQAVVNSEDLEATRHEIENMQRALQGVSSHVEAVDRNLAKTDVRIDALEQNAPPEDLDQILNSLSAKSDVQALQTRLASLEKYNSIEATEMATLALAAADIAEASKGSAPFVTELDAFNVLSPGNATARELRAYAVAGVATENVLAKQFEVLMNAAIRDEKLAKGDKWYKKSWASFTTTFDVRRVGEVEGTTTKAILSRAEVRVKAGDLFAAAGELEALQGAAQETMAPWVHDVKARTRLDGLVAKLNAGVLSELNATLKAAGER
ncbi:MAG: hypothetical protein EP347_06350 [Alphaproteobacteria bacterium]|nr:MAG: hypothetical protein EP347_06350 [Alphaproteobacteria bacterium]